MSLYTASEQRCKGKHVNHFSRSPCENIMVCSKLNPQFDHQYSA